MIAYVLVSNMGKHRSRLGILAKILSVVREKNGAKKTQIMYQAYLSYKLLINYLDDMIKAELIEFGANENYLLTGKGLDFLGLFEEYSNSRKLIKCQLDDVENKKLVLEKMCPVS